MKNIYVRKLTEKELAEISKMFPKLPRKRVRKWEKLGLKKVI